MHPLKALLVVLAIDPGAHLQVFAHRQLPEHIGLLRNVADAAPGDLGGGEPANLVAADPDRALARPHQPGDGLDGGRFPGPVGADDGGDLAHPRLQRDPVDDVAPAISGIDLLDLEQGLRHHAAPPR